MSLLMRNGKFLKQYGKLLRASAASYAEFLKCCCGAPVGCCNILAFYAALEITGDIEGDASGSGGCWQGPFLSVPVKGFTVADFEMCCIDGVGGTSGTFRITMTITNSSGFCDVFIDETFTQQAPCCPLDQTFTIPIPSACDVSEVLTFTLRTPEDPPCP